MALLRTKQPQVDRLIRKKRDHVVANRRSGGVEAGSGFALEGSTDVILLEDIAPTDVLLQEGA